MAARPRSAVRRVCRWWEFIAPTLQHPKAGADHDADMPVSRRAIFGGSAGLTLNQRGLELERGCGFSDPHEWPETDIQ